MTSGLVVSVSPRNVGDVLTADAPVGTRVLPVSDACEFDEEFDEPRYLVVGETLTPLKYVAVENDDNAAQQTVTLAAPLPFAAEAGLPLTLWDPTVEASDKRAIEFIAQVRLDDQQDATIPATIEHETVPLAVVYSLEGARVALDDDDGEWFVSRVLGRAAVVDSGYIRAPYASAVLPAGVSWPATGPMPVTTWRVSDSTSIVYEGASGIFRITEDGMYRATFGATFEANGTGNRRIFPRKHFADGTTDGARDVIAAAVAGQPTALEVTFQDQRMYAGEGLSFEVAQTSGASLMLLGSTSSRSRPTEVAIRRVEP